MLGLDHFAAVNDKGELLLRNDPLPLRFELTARSAEGDDVALTLTVDVRIAPGASERRLFRQTFASAGIRSVSAADVARAWQAGVRAAIEGTPESALPALTTELWLNPDATLSARLARPIETAAYLAGMELTSPVRIGTSCSAYQVRKQDERRRRDREEAEARRLDSARKAADAMAEAREKGIAPSDVLARVGADEGQSLLLAALGNEAQAGGSKSGSALATVWCVAGNALVAIRPAGASGAASAGGGLPASPGGSPRWATEVRELGGELGPLRSVMTAQDRLLVGARDGVWVVPISGEGSPTAYRDAAMPAEHGFAGTSMGQSTLWAVHRQRGLVWWDVATKGVPRGFIRPAASNAEARPGGMPPPLPTRTGEGGGLMPPPLPPVPMPPLLPPPVPPVMPPAGGAGQDASILRTQAVVAGAPALPGLFSAVLAWGDGALVAGSDLEFVSPEGSRSRLGVLTSRCVMLCEAEGFIAAVCEDGQIRLFDPVDLRPAGEVHVADTRAEGPVSTAAVLPWAGGVRILVATGSAVIAMGVRDPVSVRYASAHRGVREVAGGYGIVAGVSPDRMRVILWDAWEPRRPVGEIHIGALVRGRVGDIAVVMG